MTKPQPDTSDCARIGPEIWRSKLWILLSGLGLLLLSLSVAISVGSVAIPRPAKLAGLEDLPQRVQVIDNNADAVKAIIRNKVGG